MIKNVPKKEIAYEFSSINKNSCLNQEGFLLPILKLKSVVLSDSWFKTNKYYVQEKIFFLYDKKKGIYTPFDKKSVMVVLNQCFIKISVQLTFLELSKLTDEISVSEFALLTISSDEILQTHTSFLDCVYDSKDGEMLTHSPEFFVTRFENCIFKESKPPLEFLIFLEQITEKDQLKALLFQCFLNSLLKGNITSQIILFVLGMGGTGKSILINVLVFCAGENFCINTDLFSLAKDRFETSMLRNARLIILADSNVSSIQEFSVLKSLSGGDRIKSRAKFSNEPLDFRSKALIVLVSNFPLDTSHDTSKSLERRIRLLTLNKVVQKPVALLEFRNQNWFGKLSSELPGILKWANQLSPDFVHTFLTQTFPKASEDKTPNIIDEFCRSFLEYKLDSYVYIRKQEIQGSIVEAYQKFILDGKDLKSYDKSTTSEKTIGAKELGELILLNFNNKNLTVSQKRRENGLSLSNIRLRKSPLCLEASENIDKSQFLSEECKKLLENVFDPDKIFFKEEILESNISKENSNNSFELKRKNFFFSDTFCCDKNLYSEYSKLFSGDDEFREYFESEFKSSRIDIKYGTASYFNRVSAMENIDCYTYEIQRKTQVILRKLQNIGFNRKGFTHSLKSPPQVQNVLSPGEIHFSSVPLISRRIILKNMQSSLFEIDKSLIQVKIKSSMISTLHCVFFNETLFLKEPLELGFWSYLEKNEFNENEKRLFNKHYVKLCFSSLFFHDTSKASLKKMILKEVQKERGLTSSKFSLEGDFFDLVQRVDSFLTHLLKSKLFIQIQNALKAIQETLKLKESFKGGAGWIFNVDKNSDLRFILQQILSSFELELLSRVSLALERNAENGIVFLHHLEDSNILAVEKNHVDTLIELVQLESTKIQNELGFSNHVVFVVKEI